MNQPPESTESAILQAAALRERANYQKTWKNRISNIQQGMSNDEGKTFDILVTGVKTLKGRTKK